MAVRLAELPNCFCRWAGVAAEEVTQDSTPVRLLKGCRESFFRTSSLAECARLSLTLIPARVWEAELVVRKP